MHFRLRYTIFLIYLFAIFVYVYISRDIAFAQAQQDFGNKVSLVEMPLYFITFVSYLFLMIYNLLGVSSALFIGGAVLAHRKSRPEVRNGLVWCLGLNVVVFGISLLMG